MSLDGDSLALFGLNLGPESGFGRLELTALGFEGFKLLTQRGERSNSTLGQNLGQMEELLLYAPKLLPDPFVVFLELANRLGDETVLLGCNRLHAFGLEVEQFHEFKNCPVDGLCGNVPLRAGAAYGLERGNATIVVIGHAVPAGRWLR